MNRKFAYCSLLAVLVATLFVPGLAKAQDASDAFTQYSNPHAVCEYYRSSGIVIERESDTECLTSLGEGQYKTFTQYYYSGNNWCYKLIQEGQTYHENCIPIPESTSSIDDFTPYIIGGVVIFVIIVAGASSAGVRSRAVKQNAIENSNSETTEPNTEENQTPKNTGTKQLNPIRSGRNSSYGWEEMETTTTDTGEDMTKGPGLGQSQGGIGIHQGEPIVAPAISNVASEIEKLVKLKNKGAITQKEFNIAKKKLLR
ncbi:MAG TPA: SHOCT domain-containing protein [Candidatus Angelobacter sp.]|nr:SHOCT domain-containing protein [Candidatus Angelobacter sp.]